MSATTYDVADVVVKLYKDPTTPGVEPPIDWDTGTVTLAIGTGFKDDVKKASKTRHGFGSLLPKAVKEGKIEFGWSFDAIFTDADVLDTDESLAGMCNPGNIFAMQVLIGENPALPDKTLVYTYCISDGAGLSMSESDGVTATASGIAFLRAES